MEQTTIEKVLNQLSEERIQDSQELKNLRTVQEVQQQSIRENQSEITSFGKDLGNLKSGQEAILKRIAMPLKQVEDLSVKIDAHGELLKKPLTQKVIHEHHFPKLLYATVVLFTICICIGMGWFQTEQRLDRYQINDTKWRKLLLGAKPTLTKIMQDVATAVDNDPEKARDAVEKEEKHNQQVWDLHQKMLADSAEMRALKTANPSDNNTHKNKPVIHEPTQRQLPIALSSLKKRKLNCCKSFWISKNRF
jgi:hypothetical protein